jgi:hypothetical protein
MKIGHIHFKNADAQDGTKAGHSKPVRLVMTKKGWQMEIGGVHDKSMPDPNHHLHSALAASKLWISRRKGTCLKKPKVNL